MVVKDTTGKLTDNAIKVLERRYLIKDTDNKPIETPIELFRRVADALASTEQDSKEWSDKFFQLMWDLDFMPNSPTLMNAGTGAGTLSACYVLDIDDSMSSIMMTAHDQAMIEKFGGGIGFSLSALRPKDTPITTTQGRACGPVAVLQTLPKVASEMGHIWQSCLFIIPMLKNLFHVKQLKAKFITSTLVLGQMRVLWRQLRKKNTFI